MNRNLLLILLVWLTYTCAYIGAVENDLDEFPFPPEALTQRDLLREQQSLQGRRDAYHHNLFTAAQKQQQQQIHRQQQSGSNNDKDIVGLPVSLSSSSSSHQASSPFDENAGSNNRMPPPPLSRYHTPSPSSLRLTPNRPPQSPFRHPHHQPQQQTSVISPGNVRAPRPKLNLQGGLQDMRTPSTEYFTPLISPPTHLMKCPLCPTYMTGDCMDQRIQSLQQHLNGHLTNAN